MREGERDRDREKSHKTIFLPGECNSMMEKEGGPRHAGPLIKLSEKGVIEGAKEREREGGMEGVKDRE